MALQISKYTPYEWWVPGLEPAPVLGYNKCYVRPVWRGDRISIGFTDAQGGGIDISFKNFDTDAEIATAAINAGEAWVDAPASNYLGALAGLDGTPMYMEISNQDASGNTWRSSPFRYYTVAVPAQTVLITYAVNVATGNTVELVDDAGDLRLEGQFYHSKTERENEVIEKSTQSMLGLAHKLYLKRQLEVGYSPAYIHEALERALLFDQITVKADNSGISYPVIARDAYETDNIERFNLRSGSIWLTIKDQLPTNIYGAPYLGVEYSVPPTPANFGAVLAGDEVSVDVSWDDNAPYLMRLYRSLDGVSWQILYESVDDTEDAYNDTEVMPGQKYYYRAKFFDGPLESLAYTDVYEVQIPVENTAAFLFDGNTELTAVQSLFNGLFFQSASVPPQEIDYPFAISMRVYIPASVGAEDLVLFTVSDGSEEGLTMETLNNGVLRCKLHSAATSLRYRDSLNPLPEDEWVHIIWRYGGSRYTMNVSVNDELSTKAVFNSGSYTYWKEVGPYHLGYNAFTASTFSPGGYLPNGVIVDEMAVWTKQTLNGAEGQEAYEKIDLTDHSRYDDLALYWRLEQDLLDDSPRSNNATLDGNGSETEQYETANIQTEV